MRSFLWAITLFFLAMGFYGLGMWLGGASFWRAAGPLIVQGFGCALALGYWLVTQRRTP